MGLPNALSVLALFWGWVSLLQDHMMVWYGTSVFSLCLNLTFGENDCTKQEIE